MIKFDIAHLLFSYPFGAYCYFKFVNFCVSFYCRGHSIEIKLLPPNPPTTQEKKTDPPYACDAIFAPKNFKFQQ